MDATTPRETHATDDEAREIHRLQRSILSRFLVVFSVPFVVIMALAVMSYKLSQKVEKIELLQDIMQQEVFYEQGKSYTQLIAGYEKLRQNGLHSPLMVSRLASLYFERNAGHDRDEAFQLLNSAKASFSDTKGIYQTLCALYTIKNTEDEAIEHCEQSIKLDPNDHQSYNNAAWIYANSQNKAISNIEKALRYAKAAVTLTTERNTDDLDTLAKIYFLQGEAAKAQETIQKVEVLLDKKESYRTQMARFQANHGHVTTE
jgi:tetratricopeptide (TPR) repeat protein